MNERAMRFYEVVSGDEALRAELGAAIEELDLEGKPEEEARQAVAEAVVAFAKGHDLDLTVEDVYEADAAARDEGELSEAELEAIAGGEGCACLIVGAANKCGCAFVGVADSPLGFCLLAG